MKLLEMLNMTKGHVVRVLLCSIATMSILLTISVLNRVFMYIFTSWNLDLINTDASVPFEVVITVIAWNYILGITVVGLLWKFVGLPKITLIGRLYKEYMDSLYED